MTLHIDGMLNLRDLGGTPTGDGRRIRTGRLWRSENQTGLGASALQAMVDAGLTDVIDLRTDFEVKGSPSPFAERQGIAYHHLSFFPEAEDDDAEILEDALPWMKDQPAPDADSGNADADDYLSFLRDRPDSVLAALRAIAQAEGAALVHCAVGRDRTGFTVALALALAGVPDEPIVDDYVATAEHIEPLVWKLWSDPTYAAEKGDMSKMDLLPERATLATALEHVRRQWGSAENLLRTLGWTDADQEALRSHLLD